MAVGGSLSSLSILAPRRGARLFFDGRGELRSRRRRRAGCREGPRQVVAEVQEDVDGHDDQPHDEHDDDRFVERLP